MEREKATDQADLPHAFVGTGRFCQLCKLERGVERHTNLQPERASDVSPASLEREVGS